MRVDIVSGSSILRTVDIPNSLADYVYRANDRLYMKLVDYNYLVNIKKILEGKKPDIENKLEEKFEGKEDVVNSPKHYKLNINGTELEAHDIIEALLKNYTGISAFDFGNLLKYLIRHNKKNGLEDLKKAQWYLNSLINKTENID